MNIKPELLNNPLRFVKCNMKASQTQLFKILDGRKQYLIPIYQRTYSWTKKQCEQLWADIIRISENENTSVHFIGSIVYIEDGLNQASDISHLRIIDGQQRLATILLFLTALGEAIEANKSSNGISKVKIQNAYLLNRDEEGEKYYKLILTQSDKNTLMDILDGRELSENSSKNLVNNYEFFKEQIKNCNLDLDSLYRGFLKLIIVDIALDNHDNPQLIFESLNSTGLELSQADLIRNYVLMGLERQVQNEIYKNYWYKMEENFGHSDGSEYFDRFMRDYLTIKINVIPKENEVYSTFKRFFKMENKPVEELVKDIYYYSKFFTFLAFVKTPDSNIAQKIHDINSLRVDVAYPFLLEIFVDFDKNVISREEFLEILDLLESYVFRRQICDIPTNSLNKTFAGLYKMINKTDYLPSLKSVLVLKESYRRFPTDAEFFQQFQVKNIYNFRSKNYLFRKLENFERKELVNIDEYSIEHIMPQNENVPSVWREELGENWQEIHERFVHKVGNLTLTGYNSELRDKSFKEKQNIEGGFRDSPIRLNSGIATLEHWNKQEIQKRSKRLADKALNIWNFPKVQQESLERYQPIKEEHNNFETSSNAAKLAWATRRVENPEKFGKPTSEDLNLLAKKNTRLGKSYEIDTIVCASSDSKSLEQVFLKDQHWYKILISDKMKNKIKYIAMYESAPVSAIRYIGKIKEIIPFEDSEFSEIILSEKPERIKPIKNSEDNPHLAPQSRKYTTKSRLDTAETLEDIFGSQ